MMMMIMKMKINLIVVMVSFFLKCKCEGQRGVEGAKATAGIISVGKKVLGVVELLGTAKIGADVL
jgi:hypothetical protein